MRHYLITASSVFFCLMLGKAVNHFLGGLPASLYGLIFFAGLLSTGLLNTEKMGPSVARCIYFMPIVFLPVCVGVMRYFDLFADVGWKILLVGMVSTLVGLTLVAWSAYTLFFKSSDTAERDIS